MGRTHNGTPECAQYENALYWESLHTERAGEFSAVGYPELGEGFNRATYKMRLQALERLLKRGRACPVRSLLEGGVGIGAYAPLWRRVLIGPWAGLDISPTAIDHMTRMHPAERFYTADLCSGKDLDEVLGQARFDLVTAIDILYHIVEDRPFVNALRNLARRVQCHGHFVVSDIFGRHDHRTAAHVKRRSLATYGSILEPLGFRLVEREAVFAILGHGGWRSRNPADLFLSAIWRSAAKFVRVVPIPARNFVGATVAYGLRPLDAVLRWTGVTKGLNLELALFCRDA